MHTIALAERRVITVGRGPVQLCAAPDDDAIVALPSGGAHLSILDGRTAEVRAIVEVGRAPWNAIGRGRHVYVALHTELPSECVDAVQVVDISAGRLVETIQLPNGSRPKMLVAAFERNVLYSLNSGNGTVSEIDLESNRVVRTVEVGRGPHYGQRENGVLYVANGESNDVTFLDESTFAVIGRVAVGRGPERCVVFKGRGQVYTNDQEDDTLSIVDVSAQRLLATITVEHGPFRITPWACRGRDEWAALCRQGSLQLIDSQTHVVTDTLRLPGPVANWNWGLGPHHQTVYITLASEPRLVVLDTGQSQLIDGIPLSAQPEAAAHGPGIVISKSGGVFVSCEDAVVLLTRAS